MQNFRHMNRNAQAMFVAAFLLMSWSCASESVCERAYRLQAECAGLEYPQPCTEDEVGGCGERCNVDEACRAQCVIDVGCDAFSTTPTDSTEGLIDCTQDCDPALRD